MTPRLQFALNHMSAPDLDISEFFDLAANLGIDAVEIRNDLAGQAILDGTSPEFVRSEAESRGLDILSINALQRFNEWNTERKDEANHLARYAAACGARALVLVPVNDGTGRADGERQANLRNALAGLAPILDAHGIRGLVEPLGFEICSLRLKSETAQAIREAGLGQRFSLVHDTFHHHLAGERETFPELTGLVHISGAEDGSVSVADMRDGHRVLVGSDDRLENIRQIKSLRADGYIGPFSFEPFSDQVNRLADVASPLRASMEFIRARVDGTTGF